MGKHCQFYKSGDVYEEMPPSLYAPGEPPSIVCSHPDEAAQAMMKQDAPAGVRDAYAYIAENCPFFCLLSSSAIHGRLSPALS